MSQKNNGVRSFISTAAIVRGVRVKLSSGEVVVTGAGEEGIGVTVHGADAGAPVAVELDGHTVEAVAAEAIASGADVYPAASGKVGATPAGVREGIAITSADADGDFIEYLQKPLGA